MKKKMDEEYLMNTIQLQKIIDEDMKETHEVKHTFIHGVLIVLLFFSIVWFFITIRNPNQSIIHILSNLFLTLFIILYIITSLTYKRNRKRMILFSSILLFIFLILSLFGKEKIAQEEIHFSGKSVEEVMKWAKKNQIEVEQIYEYSDIVDSYHVIYEDYEKEKKKITIAVSEGMNPYKEIMIPSMISWNSDQVLEFVNSNSLSNVTVEYISSDQAVDTVIEQSATGTLRRNEELKLIFSYGEELGFQEVSLIDFTNKSKFEVELFMKKNHLRYELKEDYSKKVKKGKVIEQSISSGTVIPVDDQKVIITLSRGPSVTVINFKDYDTVKITNWAIQNKMKVHFLEQYDDSISKGKIISVSPEEGTLVEQGSSLEVVVSQGALKMPKFKDLNEFYEWANKHNIAYLEEHEFHDTVKIGEVISYSYKEGEVIKNHDAIIVKISDGSKKVVPDLKGLTKEEAIEKLDKLGLHYNFIYKDSDSTKDTVLNQSIAPLSEISTGLTITITVSN